MTETTPKRPVGRPRSIDRDKIVRAANEIGAERLTMRAVAQHLGVTTQALYNHIGGRRELMALLANDYGDVFDIPLHDAADWRELLMGFARALRQRLLDRPGTAASVTTRGPTSPDAVLFVDRFLGAMRRELGVDEQVALLAYRSVLELVIGSVQRAELEANDPDNDRAHRALFYEALTNTEPQRLEHLAFIAAGWGRYPSATLFEYTLTCLVDGIAANAEWLASHEAEVAAGHN
ncbi:MAG: TetR/AcrR family transcriptional regulator C-terminal domain-containing protein [Acidimicrobiia bacterium]|nr:TetR/AcrR family transcriptional regulator C-terminal domain-containing protein [Acidimicrobiia bacterium]